MVSIPLIALLIILVILSGFFSGSETALISITEVKAKTLSERKVKGADSLYRLKKDQQKALVTILICNNLVNIAAASIATFIALEMFQSIGVGIATGIMTIIILIFGEVVPKSFVAKHNQRIGLRIARIIEYLGYILSPVIIPLIRTSDYMTKGYELEESPKVTEDELKNILEVGEEEKVIEKHEKEFMHGVLKSGETTVREVMVPRTKMFVINSNESMKDALENLIKSKYSRAPIIKESRDKIVGVITLKELLSANALNKPKQSVIKIARKPIFVSQKEIVGNLIRELQSKSEHMAIVVDEFGGVEGLLTLEDLIEEILGEIADESEDRSRSIKRLNKNTIEVNGDTDIADVEKIFGINFEVETESATINGLLHHLLKDLPKVGDKIEINETELIVISMKNKRPKRIRIIKH
ncbi:MAG: hemolysin family protein [Thermoproteota archaeon]